MKKGRLAELVDRFLSWPLPKSVRCDSCCMDQNYPHERIGTNLLTADEARQMLEHVLQLQPFQPPADNAHVAPGCEQFHDTPSPDRGIPEAIEKIRATLYSEQPSSTGAVSEILDLLDAIFGRQLTAINPVTRDGILSELFHAVNRAMKEAHEDAEDAGEVGYFLPKREGDKINAVLDHIEAFDRQQDRPTPPGPPAPTVPPGPKPVALLREVWSYIGNDTPQKLPPDLFDQLRRMTFPDAPPADKAPLWPWR